MHDDEHRGIILATFAILCSAGMSVFVKLSSSASVPTLVFARFALGVPLLMWVVKRKNIHLTWKDLPKNLIRSVAGIIALYTFYFALQTLPLVNAITLGSTAPLFLPLILLFWSKMVVSKRRLIAVTIGFLGVVIILRPSTGDFVVLGSIFGLVSGFFRAIAMLNVRYLAKTENTETILAYYFFTGAVLSIIPVFFDWKTVTDPVQWLYIFLAGLFALVYQYLFTKASAFIPATKVSAISYITVIFGGFFGWLIFNEIPDAWSLVGVAVIICGALLALTDTTASRSLK